MGNEKAQNGSSVLVSKSLSCSFLGNQCIDPHLLLHGPPDGTLLKQLTYRKSDPWIKKTHERKNDTWSVWRIYYWIVKAALHKVNLLLLDSPQITRSSSSDCKGRLGLCSARALGTREVDFASRRIFAGSIMPIMGALSDQMKGRILFSTELSNDERSSLGNFPLD